MKKLRSFLILCSILIFAPSASAHVGYLLSEEEFAQRGGANIHWLLSALSDPFNVLLILVTGLVLVTFILLTHQTRFVEKIEKNLELKEIDYQRIFPWIIRLALGITLIGAASTDSLISPILSGMPQFAFWQTVLGFLLLIGLFLEISIVFTILLFLYALSMNFYLLGNIDFLALAIAFFFIGDSRPGLDDLLEVPCFCLLTKVKDFLPLVLRIGVGGGMIFLAIYEKFLNPLTSAYIVEQFRLASYIPVSVEMWVFSVGVIELFVGLFLILGFFTRLSSAIAFFVLSLSFFFFGEDVYSHLTLFAVLSILFVTGGNRWSLDGILGQHIIQRSKIK